MPKVSSEVRYQLATSGAALANTWGGPQKQMYYTPSGEEVWAIPGLRQWVRKDENGRVVASGTRDANLDKGWTTTPPTELKLNCGACSYWHDTEDELVACKEKRDATARAWEKKASAQHARETATVDNSDTSDRLDKLEEGMDEIKTMLKQALGAG